jgi:hypothetical protein
VCTNTYYGASPDDQFRRGLFLKTVEKLAELDATDPGAYPLIVTDTSPEHDALKADVGKLFPSAVVLDGRDNPGIGPQTLTSVGWAYDFGAERVLRIDPEKYGLAEHHILDQVVTALDEDQSDIICIGRSPDEGFASLPWYQQITERVMSRALASLGLPEDTASGIRAFNRTGMALLLDFDLGKHGRQWEYLWMPLLDARFNGVRVGTLFLPFVHPVEMTLAEEGNDDFDRKRDNQAALIIPKVVAYAASLGIQPEWDPKRQWVI